MFYVKRSLKHYNIRCTKLADLAKPSGPPAKYEMIQTPQEDINFCLNCDEPDCIHIAGVCPKFRAYKKEKQLLEKENVQ